MDPLSIAVDHASTHKASKYMVEELIEYRIWKRSNTLNTQLLRGVSEWGTEYDMR